VLLVVGLTVGLVLAGSARAETRKDIEYGRVGEQRLLLDAYTPDSGGLHPVAILVHGGGWTNGDKGGSEKPGNGADITPWFATFSNAGFTWFSINYRMAPTHHWPAQIEDLDTAIRWVKAHATEYKGDPRHIVLVGHSAGGHIVMFAATQKDPDLQVQATVGFAPVTDLVADSERRGGVSPSLQALFGVTKEITPETRRTLAEVSPLTHVHAGMAPVLIVHGDADKSVPYPQSVEFIARLRAAGVPCELITRKGVPHSLVAGEAIDSTYREPMLAWLRAVLAGKPPSTGTAGKNP
jgi:alpha-L-fucosidase 2